MSQWALKGRLSDKSERGQHWRISTSRSVVRLFDNDEENGNEIKAILVSQSPTKFTGRVALPAVGGRSFAEKARELTAQRNEELAKNSKKRKKQYVSQKTKDKFFQLASQWYEETKYYSLVKDKIGNPKYIQLATFGMEIIPILLTEVQKNPSHWFPLLKAITEPRDLYPIKAEDRGNVKRMVNAWLKWGENEGYIG